MIITAKIARQLVNQTEKLPKNWEKSLIRQLRGVEKAIGRASRKKKRCITYHRLDNYVIETLRTNGFKVEICGNYDFEWIVICW